MCATIVLNQYTLLWIEQLIEVSLTILEYYAISILSMISLGIAADVVTSLIRTLQICYIAQYIY